MYILSGKKITAVYPMSRCPWDQNTTQVANRLNRARATYVRLLHVPPWSYRSASYLGWQAGTTTLCWSRLYPSLGSTNLATVVPIPFRYLSQQMDEVVRPGNHVLYLPVYSQLCWQYKTHIRKKIHCWNNIWAQRVKGWGAFYSRLQQGQILERQKGFAIPKINHIT